jgi:branched-chain amino acid transport system ATP-binding protein
MLTVTDLSVSYGAISALSGISFSIEQGSIVTLIGGNGAGKTTTLRTISGLLRPKTGRIEFLGEDITKLAAHKIVARGLCHVPEGRMIFSNLSVDEIFPWAPTCRWTRCSSPKTATTSSAFSPG